MRAILIVGMMAVAGSAWGQDFGVDYNSARSRLVGNDEFKLAAGQCQDEICEFPSPNREIVVSLILGKGRVVQMLGMEFRAHNWAEAAAYGRMAQRALLIPPTEVASLDGIARKAVSGGEDREVTPTVSCSSKQIETIPVLTCYRR